MPNGKRQKNNLFCFYLVLLIRNQMYYNNLYKSMKNQISIILVVIFNLVFVSLLPAQEADHHFTLKDALNYALTNSVAIQQSILDQERATHTVSEIRSQALPQLSGSGDFNYFPNIPTQILPGEIIGQPG